jgi:hypothetical protein
MNFLLLIMALIVINGCAESSALIKASSTRGGKAIEAARTEIERGH